MTFDGGRFRRIKLSGMLRRHRPFGSPGRRLGTWLPAIAVVLAGSLLQAPSATALDCLDTGQSLLRIPELRADKGVLRGTILLKEQEQRIAFRRPPDFNRVPDTPGPNSTHRCKEQMVRTFRGLGAILPNYPGMNPPGYPEAGAPLPASKYPDPIPGPTLRAQLGDIVQLTLLNQLDPYAFDPGVTRGRSTITAFDRPSMDPGTQIDRAEKGLGSGCDETIGFYPKGPSNGEGLDQAGNPGGNNVREDRFPNCFHGSTTGNIHFHGTHTSPNTTGDNVFIQVRPSLIKNGKPVVTADSVRKPFDRFFADCHRHLRSNVLLQWPKTWSDLPSGWTKEQQRLLQAYDKDVPPDSRLWPPNKQNLDAGLWPLYYIGAYPFCFQLPDYDASARPAEKAQAPARPHMGLPSQTERTLQMGQAPGTHWYHAHKHGSTATNVANGLTGAFIIEGKSYDGALNEFYGKINGEDWTRAQPVLVINQLGASQALQRGPEGRPAAGSGAEDFSVNGRVQPKLVMRPGQVQLWRIVNTSSRSGVFFVGPPDLSEEKKADPSKINPDTDFEWRQIAQDGVQFADLNYRDSRARPFLLAAGNRADVLVRAPSTAPGKPIAVKVRHWVSAAQSSKDIALMFVSVEGPPVTDRQSQFVPTAPPRPEFLNDIPDEDVKSTKIITFNSTGPWHTIDGKFFDDTVGQAVVLNKVEEWRVENTSIRQIDHPFHIHINPFQVVEVFDPSETFKNATGKTLERYVFGPKDDPGQCELNVDDRETWKPCVKDTKRPRIWWDVFPIPAGKMATNKDGDQIFDSNGKQPLIPGYFKMRSRFVDYPGWFVIHCHILAHEDRGMMTVVHVTPFAPPVAHH